MKKTWKSIALPNRGQGTSRRKLTKQNTLQTTLIHYITKEKQKSYEEQIHFIYVSGVAAGNGLPRGAHRRE